MESAKERIPERIPVARTMIHIGQQIKAELARQERGVSWFARKLAYDRSNIYRLFQKESIDTLLLKRISHILNHDFFADLSDTLRNEK